MLSTGALIVSCLRGGAGRFAKVEEEADGGAGVLAKTVGWEMAMEAVGRLATFLFTTGCRV